MSTSCVVQGLSTAGIVTVVACGRKESYGGDTSTSAAADASVGQSTPAESGGARTDANIVAILDQANAANSARGALAETKATSPDVKNFGKLMAGEHDALRLHGQRLAAKLGVTPQPPAGDQRAAGQAGDGLPPGHAQGQGVGRPYIDCAVTYHQQVLQTATKALDAAQNPELTDLIRKAAPVLQHHLDRAGEIQQKLGT